MYKNPYKAYQTTQVTTARPEKILLMLYEGAIKFNKVAMARMKDRNIAEKGKYISKTLAIVSELMNTLDHEVGGQLANDLENLYMFIMDKLIEANLRNSIEDLELVEKLLMTLYTAWEDVVNNPRADGVPSPNLQPDLHQAFSRVGAAPSNQPSKQDPSRQDGARSGLRLQVASGDTSAAPPPGGLSGTVASPATARALPKVSVPPRKS